MAAIDPATGRHVAAIEVLHTHEVGDEKRSQCAAQGIAVLEVTAREVERVRQIRMRCSAAPGAELAPMVFETTDVQFKQCSRCIMETEFVVDWNRQVDAWAAYDKHWELYCSQKQVALKTMQEARHRMRDSRKRTRVRGTGACRGKCKVREHRKQSRRLQICLLLKPHAISSWPCCPREYFTILFDSGICPYLVPNQ